MKQMHRHTATLWSLRPAGEHAGLRKLLQAKGLRLRALPMVRLVERAPGEALGHAWAADLRVFTSPAAVRFAAKRVALSAARGPSIAVGDSTARALALAGVAAPITPSRMDSEGVLALPELVPLQGKSVGLFTAPGGRGLLPARLAERGATVWRADVYERRALRLKTRTLSALAHDERAILLASSAEALGHLQNALRGLPPVKQHAIWAKPLVVSSARLAHEAQAMGYRQIVVADNARPDALCDAAFTLIIGDVQAVNV